VDLTELLLHPVRLRIVFAAMDGVPFTTSEMSLRLPDVSKASMYRQLALLTEGELLEVVSENLVRGIVERHYRLVRVRAVIDPAAAAAMTNDDHRRGFAAATASMIAEFNAYLDRPGSNPTADSVSYRQFPLWLSGTERTALVKDVYAVIQRHSKHERSTDRIRHLLATVFFPTGSRTPDSDHEVRRDSDEDVLRELADEGNEAAEARLTELAVERDDVDELRRLADDGNDRAARRLADMAVERGDVDELRRLTDEGNEHAEVRLSELIRGMGSGDSARRKRRA
jgi:DNA-binding transcriptional ArsR family regulator